MTIKAIETRYAGCRFRSRLEARWAVFFDSLGVAWEYEKEGFETPDGGYLPDFWLPNGGGWWEIKGEAPSEHDLNRCRWVPGLCVLVGDIPRDIESPDTIQWLMYGSCSDCEHVGPCFCGHGSVFCRCAPGQEAKRWFTASWDEYWPFGDNPRRVSDQEALNRARSARFEHGESGAPKAQPPKRAAPLHTPTDNPFKPRGVLGEPEGTEPCCSRYPFGCDHIWCPRCNDWGKDTGSGCSKHANPSW